MYLATSELEEKAFVMADQKAARYLAHDLFQILYRMQRLQGLLACMALHGDEDVKGYEHVKETAAYASDTLEELNDSFLELHEMFECCNELCRWHGDKWKEHIGYHDPPRKAEGLAA